MTHNEIASELQVSRSGIVDYVQYLRSQAKESIKEYTTEHLPTRLIKQVCNSGVISIYEEKRIEIGTKISTTTTTSSTEKGIKSIMIIITLFTTIAKIDFQTQLGVSIGYGYGYGALN